MHRTVLRIIKCSLFVIWAYICNIGRVVFMISYICLYIEYSLFVNITKMNEWSYIWKTKNYNKYEELEHLFMRMKYESLYFLLFRMSSLKRSYGTFCLSNAGFSIEVCSQLWKYTNTIEIIILDMKFLCRILIMKFILIGIDALMIDLYAMDFLIVRGRKTKIQNNAYSIRR